MEKNSSFKKIYEVVKKIPKGYVATYGMVAKLAGNKRWARVVGYALHVNPDPLTIPCHRVVNREGRVSKAFVFGGENKQIELLKSEGIKFKKLKSSLEKDVLKSEYVVDLAKHLWDIPIW